MLGYFQQLGMTVKLSDVRYMFSGNAHKKM